MSDERLPLHIDPVRLAKSGAHFSGYLPLASMPRLVPALQTSAGEAEVDMCFAIDREGRATVRLHLRAAVALVCQRCLEPMVYGIDTDRQLGVVGSTAEAERLPEQYEPLVVTGEPLFLRDLIEDELILSLPLVPRHGDGECALATQAVEGTTDDVAGGEANPFAILAGLKKTVS